MLYQKLLSFMKEWLEETQISEWCTNYCRGGCCQVCQDLADCDNRLACKVFLCSNLTFHTIPNKERDIYYALRSCVVCGIESKHFADKSNLGKCNAYFTPYKNYLDSMEIPDHIVNEFKTINTKKIKRQISFLIGASEMMDVRKSIEKRHKQNKGDKP